jgi:ABC-2 type transport system permease protein
MKRILPIIRKEFLHILRDPRTLIAVLILPSMLLILFGYALTFDVKNIDLLINDADKSELSRQLIDGFKVSGKFRIVGYTEDRQDIEKDLKNGSAKVGLVIPRGFSACLKAKRAAPIQTVIDGANPLIAQSARNYTLVITQGVSARLAGSTGTPPVNVSSQLLYNPELKSVNFIVPGIITLILMMIPAVITSSAIVREKETGTIEQIIVSPVRPVHLMLGKITPYLMISAFDAFLITLVGVVWFGVILRGSVWLLALAVFVYMISTVGIGLLISTIAETQLVAQMAAFLSTMLPSFLLSGFVFPISSMPKVVQYISVFIPARYFLIVVRGIFLKGVGLDVFWREALILLFFGLIMISLSSLRFTKRLR